MQPTSDDPKREPVASEPLPLDAEGYRALMRHPYGTSEVSESGIDISQLKRNRLMTPEQRIRQMVVYSRFFARVRGTARSRS